jgi:hypothetical protein
MESPSVNVNANARSLAKLAAYMANGGTFQGKQMLTENGMTQMCAGITDSPFAN